MWNKGKKQCTNWLYTHSNRPDSDTPREFYGCDKCRKQATTLNDYGFPECKECHDSRTGPLSQYSDVATQGCEYGEVAR